MQTNENIHYIFEMLATSGIAGKQCKVRIVVGRNKIYLFFTLSLSASGKFICLFILQYAAKTNIQSNHVTEVVAEKTKRIPKWKE